MFKIGGGVGIIADAVEIVNEGGGNRGGFFGFLIVLMVRGGFMGFWVVVLGLRLWLLIVGDVESGKIATF